MSACLSRHRPCLGRQGAQPVAFQHASRTRSRALIPLATKALRRGQPFNSADGVGQSSHPQSPKPRWEGKKHAASDGAHAVHNQPHNRATEEDEQSLQVGKGAPGSN
jgi:hypothetical protein